MSPDALRYRTSSINEFEIVNSLRQTPNREIKVTQLSTGRIFRLCLNSCGQLCYMDGNNKRLMPNDTTDFEIYEEAVQPDQGQNSEIAGATKRQLDTPLTVDTAERMNEGPVSLPPTSMDILHFIRGFNAFVEHAATVREKAPQAPNPAKIEVVEELKTNFRVVVPPDYQLEDLAIQYVIAITTSITDLKTKVLPKTSYEVDKFTTTGLVKDIPGLMPIIQDALEKAGYGYSFVPTGGAYLRLTAWLE